MKPPAEKPLPGGAPLGYMPQLDGLRAIAVVGVWFEHWGISQQPGFKYLEWGRLAVWLFFVLSGFLITGILLKSKRDIEAGHQNIPRAAKVFYIRRFLRIIPIYYLTLFAAAAAVPQVRQAFLWHLTYTTDFWTALHPSQYPAGVHFWTLAVEEQFYLVWPWIVFLLPRKRLAPTLICIIIAAISYRAVVVFSGLPSNSPLALPMPLLGNIDKFSMGSLIAILHAGGGMISTAGRKLRQAALFIGLPLLILSELSRCFSVNPATGHLGLLESPMDSKFTFAFSSSVAGLFFLWLVAAASTGIGGPIGKLLASRPLRAIGKISYGLYLFHMFVPPVLTRARIPLPPPHAVWPRFAIYAAVTTIAGFASWYLIESPLNSLKSKFKYTAPNTQPAAPLKSAPTS